MATAKKSASKKPTSKKPAAKKPAPKTPAAKKPAAKKPAAKKPAPKKPAAKKPAAKKPAAKKPTAKKPVAKKPVAKKPAAKKPAPKTPAPKTLAAKAPTAKASTKPTAAAGGGTLVRSIELVELALAKRTDAAPMAPDLLEKMTLGDRPLTPALRRWLESDGDFFTLGEPQSLADMLTTEFGDYLVEAYEPVIALLTEPIVLFEGWGSDSRRFIYLGTPDAHGELPVFTVDNDDGIYLCLNGPVDVWLAQQAGALEDEHVYGSLPKAYEPARTEHAKLSFDGNVQFADAGFTARPPRAS